MIQVKTKQVGKGWTTPKNREYNLLALVDLDKELSLDKSKIWVLTKQEVMKSNIM